MDKNSRSGKKAAAVILTVYTVFVLYVMFFGFNRVQMGQMQREYRYELIPTGIPLWLPGDLSGGGLRRWLFSLGNVLVFVPFGILIPMLGRVRYWRFILAFLGAIILLETLQMLTYLGSFDVHDIIVNTVGATIGYIAYRAGRKMNSRAGKAAAAALTVLILTFLMILAAEIVNRALAGR